MQSFIVKEVIGAPFASCSNTFCSFFRKIFHFARFIWCFQKSIFRNAALITSPSYRFHIPICSMVLQKQQIKNVKHPPFIYLITEATICIAMFLFQTLKILIFFTQFLLTHHRELLSPLQKFKNMNFD